jgi:diguanylate cyclase (GGDEF)-like protein
MLDFISDIIAGAVNNARLYKTAEELATTDSLTGFYVHQYFKQRLAEEIDRARITGAMFSVIMIDIDHFKDYNDKYGHSAGDKVLVDIAVMLRKFTGEGSFMARYGGEELAIILPNMDMQGALAIAEEIREHIFLHRFLLRRKETRVTVSAGVISYSADIKGRDDLLQKVDFYLYKAKKEGRNKICAA